MDSKKLLDAALYYRRELSWSVIPVKPKGKRPLVAWEQYQREPASEEQIRRWWTEYPDANVGVVCGAVSGVVVLDVDGPEGAKSLEQFPEIEPTAFSNTGKGQHFFFKHPGDGELRNFARKLPGLDLRGSGGYIVAPPSIHASGKVYSWSLWPHQQPPADLPVWLRDLVSSNGRAQATAAPPAETERIAEGHRNDALTRLAGSMRRKGFTPEAIEAALQKENQRRCDPPLPVEEVKRIAASVGRYQPSSPINGKAPREQDETGDSPADPGGVYVVKSGTIGYMKSVGRGDDTTQLFVPLCNFTAQVVEETIRDNGVERSMTFAVEGRRSDGQALPRIQIPAPQFAGLSWVTGEWGVSARISAGQASKDRLREAIQVFSAGAERRETFTYTGWRKVGHAWLYLHAGRAVGANGQHVNVDLEPPLNRYQLPTTPEDVTEAVTRSLALLDVAPLTVTVLLLSAAYLAPLAIHLRPDFAPWLYGPTGSMKSTLAALFLSHYGNFPDKTALPATWESTENSLEKRLFTLKDALAVVDDYAPQADPTAQAKISRVAQRLVRAQGNLSGRSRMRADTSLRPDYPPRGLMVSTGEDLPPGQSVLARLLSVEVDRAQIDTRKLTEAQEHADRLPHALAGYVAWLAPQMDTLKEELLRRWREVRRGVLSCSSHLRGPEIVAHLTTGLEMFLRYAVHVRALSQEQAGEIYSEGFDTLISLAQAHDRRVRQEDPAEVFLSTLASLLAQNAVHVAPKDTVGEGDGGGVEIGWMDESYLYLIPDATRAAVARCLRDAGGHFPHSPRMLYKAMEKRGALVPGKDFSTHAVKIGPKTRRVLKVPRTALDPGNE